MKILMLVFFTLAVTVLSTFAGVKIDQFGFLDEIKCSSGQELQVFSLMADFEDLKKSDLPFKGNFSLLPIPIDSPVLQIRLEICFADQVTPYLKRIVRRIPSAGWWTGLRFDEITTEKNESHEGLAGAIFEGGDPARLEILFPNEIDSTQSYLLKGHSLDNGRKFVTLSRYDSKSQNHLLPTQGEIFYGSIKEGDPFVAKWKPAHRIVKTKLIEIELDFDYQGGPGLYMHFRFKSFTIIDKTKGTSPRSVFTYHSSSGNEDPHLKVKSTHHGLSDEFGFIFPTMEYRLSPDYLTVNQLKDGKTVKSTKTKLNDCPSINVCGQPLP